MLTRFAHRPPLVRGSLRLVLLLVLFLSLLTLPNFDVRPTGPRLFCEDIFQNVWTSVSLSASSHSEPHFEVTKILNRQDISVLMEWVTPVRLPLSFCSFTVAEKTLPWHAVFMPARAFSWYAAALFPCPPPFLC